MSPRGSIVSQRHAKRNSESFAEWKRSYNARTVLVLEDADIQLTNHQLVADALSRAEKARTDKPDEIYLVSTFLDNPWYVTCLRREGKSYYDDGERFWEVDPKSLQPLTAK